MKNRIITIGIFCIVTLLAYSVIAQDVDNQLTPEEFKNGWELLFDGSSFDGWKIYNRNDPGEWIIDDNALFCNGSKNGGDLMTKDVFHDFDLKFEWKIEKEGNSGVIYKVREGKQWGAPYFTGPEFQVFDDPGDFDNKSTGSIYDVYAPEKIKKVNSNMQWNSGRIRVSNGLITHWVNNAIVVQCEINSADWKERVAKSKWKNKPFYGKSPFGHIDLQNHGSKVWYKNLKIKRLN